jgi:AraC-like DNA-binding protein
MKKERLFWILTAALALVMGFVPELGSGLFAVLALPFTALGRMLRWLSLTGAVGNGFALVGYAAACASPLLLWLRSKRRLEDRLLFLLPPVLAVDGACFQGVLQPQNDGMTEYRLSAQLMQLYAALFSSPGHGNQHVRKVENYIRSNYMLPLRVEQLAQLLCLNRRYLGRLFKEHTGHTTQEFLIEVRLEAASMHLRRGCSVAEAARLCGYEDVSNFSKMFKRRYGIPPAAMRR